MSIEKDNDMKKILGGREKMSKLRRIIIGFISSMFIAATIGVGTVVVTGSVVVLVVVTGLQLTISVITPFTTLYTISLSIVLAVKYQPSGINVQSVPVEVLYKVCPTVKLTALAKRLVTLAVVSLVSDFK